MQKLQEAQNPLFDELEAAQMVSQVEDFGFPAILEKVNSLFTPLNNGPLGDISENFQDF